MSVLSRVAGWSLELGWLTCESRSVAINCTFLKYWAWRQFLRFGLFIKYVCFKLKLDMLNLCF